MKIVHVIPSFARGGGERLMIELANREAEAGHEASVVAAYPLPPDQTHGGLSEAVAVRYVAGTPRRGPPLYLGLLPWIWRHREWLSRQDVVHCHLTYGAMFGTVLQLIFEATRRPLPTIVETYHGVGMPIPKWHRWLHARMAARRHGLSFMVAEPYWERFRARRPRITSRVIPVGVSEPDVASIDAEDRPTYRARIGIPADARWVVGTIGRLSPDRQPHRYIPVFAAIARELGPGVHFLMGGDGAERQRIENEIAAHGLQRQVHLPGLVTDLAAPMSVTDVYVTSNVGPVPGVAGLQAVAAGLPVIAIQLTQGYEAGDADWIWSSADPDQVAARAVALLRDPDARQDLVAKQKAHLDAHHSARAMAAAYQNLYRDAGEGRRRAAPAGAPA